MSWTRVESSDGRFVGTCLKCRTEVRSGYKLDATIQTRGTMPAVKTRELLYCDNCAPEEAKDGETRLDRRRTNPAVEATGNAPRLRHLRKVDAHEWAGEMTDGVFIYVVHKGGFIYLGAGHTPRQAALRCTEPVAEHSGELTGEELLTKLKLQTEE